MSVVEKGAVTEGRSTGARSRRPVETKQKIRGLPPALILAADEQLVARLALRRRPALSFALVPPNETVPK